MGRVEPFDPRNAVVDELVAVARRWRHRSRRERIERRCDERGAASACVGAHRDELVVRALREEASGTGEGAADRGEPIPGIAQAAHVVAVGPECVPAPEGHEGPGGRMTRPGDQSSVMIAPPAVRPLPAGVAAVQLWAAWATCSVCRTVAHRTEPRLDDVLGEVSDRSILLVGAHERSVDEGCDGDDLGAREPAAGRPPTGGPRR